MNSTSSTNSTNSTSSNLHIHIIVNPGAGQNEPILNVLNAVLRPAGVKWDVFVTHQAGDARKFAQQAVTSGVDAVAVYGGDGTVTEAASGLIGSNMPLAILPGGTAVTATKLGIPATLEQAAALVCDPAHGYRLVDMGMVGDRYFMGHVAIGLEADMHQKADRDMKDRLGFLAYVASIRVLGATLAKNIRLDDGLLDVLIIRNADLASLGELVGSVAGLTDSTTADGLPHWLVRQVRIDADPPQQITADGEVLGSTPVDIKILPGAVRVIVPGDAVSTAKEG